MSAPERQQQFEKAVRALPQIKPEANITKNFGFSNSARIIENGLFACTSNLETPSKALSADATAVTQFVFLCVLRFPPEDHAYFAIEITDSSDQLIKGLLKLLREAEQQNAEKVAKGKKPGGINNNVKCYITRDGHLYFHNDGFRDSLRPDPGEPPLDPECMAKVDAVHFAIWPPAATAERGLLAREFIGYLGTLIGREKVHELQVWDDPAAVRPTMRRMPSTIPVADIEAAVSSLGGYYPGGEIRRYHSALNFHPHKHFVILTGVSGTGKTLLALQYARAIHGLKNTEDGPFLFNCPVRPEWTDPTALTGYYDVLSNRYEVPTFLAAVLVANAHPTSPVFVILDEMNLARVEYYFSDVLSAMETQLPMTLHRHGVPIEGSAGTTVPAAIRIPPNLYITGTINVDETTNPVSDKVLDRATIVDVSATDLAGYLVSLEKRFPSLKDARAACEPHLLAVQTAMSSHGLGFGYRVVEEVLRYHAFASSAGGGTTAEITDDLMVQKVLVKLRGTERQRSLLTSLAKALSGLDRSTKYLARLLGDLDEFGSFQASR